MAAIIFNVLPLIPYLSVFISFSFLWVGRQGVSLLRRRPLRRQGALRAALANAYAFTQLRALTGFDSMWGLHKRKGPLCRGPSQFKVAGKGIASARCADGPLRRLRALRATLENACAFPQLRTLSGSNPSAMGPKKKGSHCWEPNNSVVGDEGFEPPALCV